MDLFRWMGVGSSQHHTSNSAHGVKPGGVKPINHADYKQFGLENFGNTCYANSVLQALYFCQPFRELVCDSHDKSNPPIQPTLLAPPAALSPPPPRPPGLKGFRRRESATDGKSPEDSPANGNAAGRSPTSTPGSGPPIPATPPTLFSALRSLFLHIALNPSEKGTVSPTSFINKLKKENELYRSAMHQDAHEFLNFLLNKVVEDLEAEMKKNAEPGEDLSSSLGSLPTASSSTASPSRSSASDSRRQRQPHTTFVHSLFEGTLTSETRCLTCETVSSRDESFLDLSIDIEQNSSVTACLRQFSASEMLSHKNKFFCDSCGGLQEAEKRMKIKKLPNILALHLKRFKYQEDVQKYIKLSYRVAFPFELRLFNTVDDAPDPDRLYQLFAIVVHIGGGPHHGHYIAIVKTHGSWFVFDDDSVDPIRESDIPKYFGESPGGAGYVLFYQAMDLDLASVGIDTQEEATGEAEAEAEIESFGDGDSELVVPITPASAPTSPAQLKLDIPAVIEPGMPSAAPTVTPSATSAAATTSSGSHATTAAPASNGSGGGLFPNVSLGRTLKHSQSVKISGARNRERDKASTSSSGQGSSEADGSVNGDATVPVPPLVSPLTHSKSLKGKDKDRDGAGGWFSSRKKDKKDKRLPASIPIPVPPLPDLVLDDSVKSSALVVSEPELDSSHRKQSIPTDEDVDSQRLSRAVTLNEPGSSSTHSPTYAPSPSPTSPPPPTSFPGVLSATMAASDNAPSQPATPPSSLSSPALPLPIPPTEPSRLPALPVPSPRTRKTSQVLPVPPAPLAPLERPSTAGAKPKRASRKMSLTAMPLAGMFSRKDKDKDRERGEKEKDKPPLVPPRAEGRSQRISESSATR